MKFWDTSALVPLLVSESATRTCQAAYREDPTVVVAWTTMVECGSAIARAERDALIGQPDATTAFSRLDDLAARWFEVEPTTEVREIARRLLRVHRLRAADAIQLASAVLAAERRPASLTLITMDERLEIAAGREGFRVVRPDRGVPGDGPTR